MDTAAGTGKKKVLKPQDLYSLVFCDRISDIDLYKQYYRKGYDYQTSVTLTNDLNAQYSRTLMELPLMEYKEVMAYMEYAAKYRSIVYLTRGFPRSLPLISITTMNRKTSLPSATSPTSRPLKDCCRKKDSALKDWPATSGI